MDLDPLLPRPRRALADPGPWAVGPLVRPAGLPRGRVATAFERLAAAVRDATGPAGEPRLELDRDLPPEGYALVAGRDGVRVRHADDAGLAHALRTLGQWVRLHDLSDGALPGLAVEDWPDLAERGVMLDVSRDRVPRLDELFALVELLADWKLNRLQLYFEAAFAHPDFEPAWRGTDPFTADELRRLDRHCAAHGIELVPNQQSFGHLHRFLVHEPWRRLAECPEGVEHPFSHDREPFSLCPLDPGSYDFLERLYDELLPCFGSRTLNAGMDETFDLGLGRSREVCEARGKHTVYLDFLRGVHARLARRGMRMQFWADIVLQEPACVERIPGDAVAMAWGYEANHPFERELPVLAASGLDFHVCPGTSTWNSIGGRCDNAHENVRRAVRGAVDHGARGVLITDWGDRGHHQPPAVSLFGYAIAAGLGWNADADRSAEDWARLVDRHALGDTGFLGDALLRLGRLDDHNDARCENGSALFYSVAFAHEGWPHPRIPGLTADGARASGDAARELEGDLAHWTAPDARTADYAAEFAWAARTLATAADFAILLCRGVDAPAVDDAAARETADDLERCADEHRAHWTRRSRPGGLERSLRVLQRVADSLRGTGSALPRLGTP